jgi:carbon storage regulator
MLVLARSAGQSIVLGDRVTITVLATRGGLVRLGIDAPSDVGVRRGELAVLGSAPVAVDPAVAADTSGG